VVGNGLYGTDALNNFINNKTSSKLGNVNFTKSSNSLTTKSGSILTKSAWIMLSSEEIASNNYYTVPAYYYSSAPGSATGICYSKATFGLIAIHIIRKTDQFNTFLFSTFEHKNNYPNKFSYANTKDGKPDSTIPSGYRIPYVNPHSPKVGPVAYPAVRLIPEPAILSTVNTNADTVNQGTVWENYRLVGAQYNPVNRPNSINQDFFLANPVVETNQRFQFFDGAFSQAGVNNVATTAKTSAEGTVNMGGCMGCHGNAQLTGNDFSFTLQNVVSEPSKMTKSAAETLEDKCESINLTYQVPQSPGQIWKCIR